MGRNSNMIVTVPRNLQSSGSTLEGTCTASSLEPGQQRNRGSLLCYPMNTSDTPTFQFGIDSRNQLSYYALGQLVWTAIPTDGSTSSTVSAACQNFGNCDTTNIYNVTVFRMQTSGNLAGYDKSRNKIWDSHTDSGEYAMNGKSSQDDDGNGSSEASLFNQQEESGGGSDGAIQSDKLEGSSLRLSEEGVFIALNNVTTWMIRAPTLDDVATAMPSNAFLSSSPTLSLSSSLQGRPTTTTTATTVTSTTPRPSLRPVNRPSTIPSTKANGSVAVSGKVFVLDGTNGILASDFVQEMNGNETTSSLVENIVVDLYDCHDVDLPLWLKVTRTNSSGHYVFQHDVVASGSNSSSDPTTDLSAFLTEKNVTQFQARFSRLPSGYEFSNPSSMGSDVDLLGRTNCWDVEEDGPGSIIWNAGIISDTFVSTPTVQPTEITDSALSFQPSPSSSSTVTRPTFSSKPLMAMIGGFVFEDENDSGYFEGEAALSGVNVTLSDCNGTIYFTNITDKNGMYGFDNLMPGNFSVKFSAPNNYQPSSIWSGLVDEEGNPVAPNADSKINPKTGSSTCMFYGANGEEYYSVDAGMVIANTTLSDSLTSNPTNNATGDDSPCSGLKCEREDMCRNIAGICGTGMSFCNAQSLWRPDCSQEENTPILSPSSVSPNVSLIPSIVHPPTTKPSQNTVPVCNDDGTFGKTLEGSDAEKVQGVEMKFQYSLINDSGSPIEDILKEFEDELNLQLACNYFTDPCLKCNQNKRKEIRVRTRLLRSRRMIVENSQVVGLSSNPADQPNLFVACADPRPDCRVMNGVFTSYFSADTPQSRIEEETKQMMVIVYEEIESNDWNGMQVSYMASNMPGNDKVIVEPESDNGLPLAAIIGIVSAGLAILALLIFLLISFYPRLRGKRNEHIEQRIIPFEAELDESKSLSEEDDSDSDSDDSASSAECDDASGKVSTPSAVSKDDTYPTTMAQVRPQDLADEDSDSSSSSESDDENDEDDDSGTNGSTPINNVENMKGSISSEENFPVYEHIESDEYDRSEEQVNYDGEIDDMIENTNYDTNIQDQYANDLLRQYDQRRRSIDVEESSIGSLHSGDPPGRSFRDLHHLNEWDNISPPLSSISPRDHLESGINDDQYPLDDSRPYEHNSIFEYDDRTKSESHHGLASGSHHSYGSGSHHSNGSGSEKNLHTGPSNVGESFNLYHNDDNYVGEVFYSQASTPSWKVRSDHDYRDDFYNDSLEQVIDHENDNQQSDEWGQNDVGVSDHGGYYMAEDNANQSFNSYPPPFMNNAGYPIHAQSIGTSGHLYNKGRLYGDADDVASHSNNTIYSDETHQVSNKHATENEDSNSQSGYNEDEESISHIFRSLSDIQTRLATKGKGAMEMNRHNLNTSNGNRNGSHQLSNNNGWDEQELVEDVSMDGSQFSPFESSAMMNKRPWHGAWMEPVEEDI